MKELPLSSSVLIVGAGAHVPYKFPTSQQLTNLIKKIYKDRTRITIINRNINGNSEQSSVLRYKHELCTIARTLGIIKPSERPASPNDYDIRLGSSLDEFLKSFCESQVYSIDSYLSQISGNKSDEHLLIKSDWGRLLVAYLISQHERQMPFGTQEFDWIQFLIDRYIKNNLQSFFKSPPKIITFNYDRYLERCIFKHLTEFHRKSEQEAKVLVDSLPILHVYGRLGCYTKWDVSDEREFFLEAKNNIQVIGENRSQSSLDDTSTTIRQWIGTSDCQKVYFLGYGFDSLNNSLLMKGLPTDWHAFVEVFTTNVGLKESDKSFIIKNLGFQPKYISGNRQHSEVHTINLLKELEPLEKPKTIPQRAGNIN